MRSAQKTFTSQTRFTERVEEVADEEVKRSEERFFFLSNFPLVFPDVSITLRHTHTAELNIRAEQQSGAE